MAAELAVVPLIGPFAAVRFGTYLMAGAVVGTVGLILALGALLVRLWRAGEDRPLTRLKGLPWHFLLGCLLIGCQLAILNLTKIMLPHRIGFWADPFLASFDRTLFGTDPWRLTHHALGWATPWIDRIYALWGPVKFGTLLVVLSAPACVSKSRAMIAYFLTMAGGALGQYLGASAGPIFFHRFGFGTEFDDIPVSPWVATARDYLLSDMARGSEALGGGISAMPSLHVAMALWVALTVHTFWKRLRPAGWAFFAIILVGSVHLGWHYAADGIIAILLAGVSWHAAQVVAQIFGSGPLSPVKVKLVGAPEL